MQIAVLILLSLSLVSVVVFAEEPTSQPTTQPAMKVTEGYRQESEYIAVLETNFGTIRVELFNSAAPITVKNFVNLALNGYYLDLPSHRMIPGFVVQLGKHTDARSERQLKPIKGEFSDTLKHTEGVLSMARTSDPDSATSQFFVCFKPRTGKSHTHLDGKYAVFGRVSEGIKILNEIEKVPVGLNPQMNNERSKPMEPIVLRSVKIMEVDN